MLILSRASGESIVIDGGVRVVILGHDRRGVRIGIEAPSGVRILRGEIVAQVADENRRAAGAGRAWLDAVPAARPVTLPPSAPPTG